MRDEELKTIGARILKCRRMASMTQEQLAEKMDVSIQMISNLERGNKEIKISNLIKLSSILNVTTDYILTGQSNAVSAGLTDKLSTLSHDDLALVESIVERLTKT